LPGEGDGHWIEDTQKHTIEKERKTRVLSHLSSPPDRERGGNRGQSHARPIGSVSTCSQHASPQITCSQLYKCVHLHSSALRLILACERQRDSRSRCLPFSPFPQTARCDSGWGRLLNQTDYTCCSAWRRLSTPSSSPGSVWARLQIKWLLFWYFNFGLANFRHRKWKR
jgi:hypothetical protein